MSPLVDNNDGSLELYGRNHDDGLSWRYRCSLVVESRDGLSKRSTLWLESTVHVGGGRWVACGRIWWALLVGTRGWCSVDDVARFWAVSVGERRRWWCEVPFVVETKIKVSRSWRLREKWVGAGGGKWNPKPLSTCFWSPENTIFFFIRTDVDHATSIGDGCWMDGNSPYRITRANWVHRAFDFKSNGHRFDLVGPNIYI